MDRQIDKREQQQDTTTDLLNEAVKQVVQTEALSSDTYTELVRQGEQLQGSLNTVNKVNRDLKTSEKILTNMSGISGWFKSLFMRSGESQDTSNTVSSKPYKFFTGSRVVQGDAAKDAGKDKQSREDDQLDFILGSLRRIKQTSHQINDELKGQDVTINELSCGVDTAQSKLERQNGKIKGMLK